MSGSSDEDADDREDAIPIVHVEALYVGTSTDFKPSKPSFEQFSLPKQPLASQQQQQQQQQEPPSDLITALQEMGYPVGLATALQKDNAAQFPLRIWIIDNSGSMKKDDGSRVVATKAVPTGYKVVTCTRWREMRETIFFHSEMAAKMHAPTLFRLLNKPFSHRLPREFSVALKDPNDSKEEDDDKMDESNKKEDGTRRTTLEQEMYVAKNTVKKTEPKGCTPLSKRVWEIQQNIVALKPALIQRDQQIVVVLATDGLPTDRNGECTMATRDEFVQALMSLEGLPVWVVIRLCTQAEDVVAFYNSLDKKLELSLEVLDDYFQEAQELHKYNKWINYAHCLHRAREMGFHHRMFDLLDERKLTLDEVREYFVFLFGEAKTRYLPDPGEDFKGFLAAAKVIIDGEPKVFNPIHKKETRWVDIKKLAKAYNGRCNIS